MEARAQEGSRTCGCVAVPAGFRFRCRFCAWEGEEVVLDAHLNAWCPRCGKFADPVLPGR